MSLPPLLLRRSRTTSSSSARTASISWRGRAASLRSPASRASRAFRRFPEARARRLRWAQRASVPARAMWARLARTPGPRSSVRRSLMAAVRVESLERPGASTRTAVIVVSPSGDRHVYEHRHAGLDLDDPGPVIDIALQGRVLLVDASDVEASIAIARAARDAGVRVVVDVGPRLAEDRRPARPCGCARAAGVVRRDVRRGAGTSTLACASSPTATRAPRQLLPPAASAGHSPSWRGVDQDASLRRFRWSTRPAPATRFGPVCARRGAAPTLPQLDDLLDFANATAALNCRALGAQTGLPDLDEVRALVTRARHRRSKS